MNAHRESLEVRLRQALNSGDDESAAAIATEISLLIGDPPEDDHVPEPTPCWGIDR